VDLSSVNPNVHNDQEQFPIGDGKFVPIPTVAKAQSVTAASRKLQRGVEIYDGVTLSLPEAEAAAIASAVVDPSQFRNDLERKRVSLHRTPSGYTLVSVEARVWTVAVSPDGANGRGRLEVKLGGGTVWPLPDTTDATPSMRYRTRDVERLREAVRDNAKRIGSPELRQSVRQHPNGVWNPIYLVPAGIVLEDADGDEIETCGFAHTAEGSTRVVTCLEGLGVEYDAALKFAGSQIDLVRRARAAVASWLSAQPRSEDARYATRVLTMPAHVVIGVLDKNHEVSADPFPQVVSEFVESIHEQPRPWNPLAQAGVRGERLVADLVAGGQLAKDHANDVVGRDEHHESTAAPNVIAGRLLRATSHPDAKAVVRKAILEDPKRHRLSKGRYAQTVGSLLLPIYHGDKRRKTVAPALTHEFQPPALEDPAWTVREEVGIPTLLEEALAALDRKEPSWSRASRELVARGVTALAASGLIYSDQGSAVNDEAWLRGNVDRVVNNLALCAGGLKTIAEAVEFMEGQRDLMPLLYGADGEPELVEGEEYHLVAENGAGNIRLRRLAFRDAKPEDDEIIDEDASPYDRFVSLQKNAAASLQDVEALVDRLYQMRDDGGEALIDRHGFSRDILGELPEAIIKIRDNIVLAMEDEQEPLDDPDGEEDAMRAVEDAIEGIDAAEDDDEDDYDEAA
jgi:hypothetical protein